MQSLNVLSLISTRIIFLGVVAGQILTEGCKFPRSRNWSSRRPLGDLRAAPLQTDEESKALELRGPDRSLPSTEPEPGPRPAKTRAVPSTFQTVLHLLPLPASQWRCLRAFGVGQGNEQGRVWGSEGK